MAVAHTVPQSPFLDCDSCGEWVIERHSQMTISGEGSFCTDCGGGRNEDFPSIETALAFAAEESERNEIAMLVVRDWGFTERPSFYVIADPDPWVLPGRYEEVGRAFTAPQAPEDHDDPDRARAERLERAALADYYESTEG